MAHRRRAKSSGGQQGDVPADDNQQEPKAPGQVGTPDDKEIRAVLGEYFEDLAAGAQPPHLKAKGPSLDCLQARSLSSSSPISVPPSGKRRQTS